MSIDQNQNMFGCFPAVLLAFFLGFATFFSFQPASTPAVTVPEVATIQAVEPQALMPTDGVESLTIVETVTIQVSASLPATVTLQVEGYQPDGCKFPVQVEQTRTDDSVNVKIYRVVPGNVMCTMELNPYSDTITLDGTFDSGSYTLDVNGTVLTLEV